MEQAFTHAAEWEGPIVVHVLTQKGRGYAPAEEDDIQRLHDVKVSAAPLTSEGTGDTPLPVTTFTDAFTRSFKDRPGPGLVLGELAGPLDHTRLQFVPAAPELGFPILDLGEHPIEA